MLSDECVIFLLLDLNENLDEISDLFQIYSDKKFYHRVRFPKLSGNYLMAIIKGNIRSTRDRCKVKVRYIARSSRHAKVDFAEIHVNS